MENPIQKIYTETPGKLPLGFKIIALTKIICAVALVLAGMGIFHLLNNDIETVVVRLVSWFHLNPENQFITRIYSWLVGIDKSHLKVIGAGSFFYALLYLVEGVGLYLGYHWAEYLIVIISGSLLPVEIYEIIRRATSIKFAILAANLAIVTYLVYEMKKERRLRASRNIPK